MDISIHASYLPQDDPDAALAFYRDTLGFEVRNDVGYKGCAGSRWDRPASPAPPSCCTRRSADPGITDDERRTVAEMMAKGTYASINLAAADLEETFERVQASGAEVVQEPIDQPYGVRDCAFRDPAGNMVRIQEVLPMKTMTCRQLGGACDLELRGETADDVIKAQDKHLKEVVAGGDTAHEQALKEMKGRWKNPIKGMGWYKNTKKEFAALPED